MADFELTDADYAAARMFLELPSDAPITCALIDTAMAIKLRNQPCDDLDQGFKLSIFLNRIRIASGMYDRRKP